MWHFVLRLLGRKSPAPRAADAAEVEPATACLPGVGPSSSRPFPRAEEPALEWTRFLRPSAPPRPATSPAALSPEAAAYAAIPFERRKELRRLDAELAIAFMFFVWVEFGPSPSSVLPKGLPRDDYDVLPRLDGRRDRVTVPYYSTDEKDFSALEERVKSLCGGAYLAVLAERGLSEAEATLEQKCRAALEARSRPRSGG